MLGSGEGGGLHSLIYFEVPTAGCRVTYLDMHHRLAIIMVKLRQHEGRKVRAVVDYVWKMRCGAGGRLLARKTCSSLPGGRSSDVERRGLRYLYLRYLTCLPHRTHLVTQAHPRHT